MKVAIFSSHEFEKDFLIRANQDKHELKFIDTRLAASTVPLASGCECVSLFTSDDANAEVLESLHKQGIQYIALRTAGFNHIDLKKANELGIPVARVPAYSPFAVAEHTVALILALNRKLIQAHHRIMDLNFSLNGLVGFDMNQKTVGIIGTGKIGEVVAKILHGFGCRILAFDQIENAELKEKYEVTYTGRDQLFMESDIITLHVPLNAETRYMIEEESISQFRQGVMLINTSRGGLVHTKSVINALKTKKIGFFGMDVYEEEEGLFFEDHSEEILLDDTIARLMTFKNVLITSHQAFLTQTALENIAGTTISNLDKFENGEENENEIRSEND